MNCKYCGGTTLFGQCQHSNCGALQPKQTKKNSGKSTKGWMILIGIGIFLAALQWTVNTVGSFFK